MVFKQERASLVAQTVKRLQCWRPGFDPWVGKIPWRRKWQSTPVLLPGKSHGLRSLVGYSPWGCKESDTTERLDFRQEKAAVLQEYKVDYACRSRDSEESRGPYSEHIYLYISIQCLRDSLLPYQGFYFSIKACQSCGFSFY